LLSLNLFFPPCSSFVSLFHPSPPPSRLFSSLTSSLSLFLRPPSNILITLSTAHPAKFNDAVQSALPSLDFDKDVTPKELRGIEQRERRVELVSGGEKGVRQIVERVAKELKGHKDLGAEVASEVPVVAAA